MWLRVVLLVVYVLVLFLLARLLEAVSWIESGHLSRRLLDPMNLSVTKLKALLEQRGISFETAVEKQDLKELVETSGVVTEDELEESSTSESAQVTNFSAGSHFLEQVEDAKDSVWLVQVHSDQHPFNYLVDHSWKTIRKEIHRFGVRVGNFDCKLDRRFCYVKGWDTSRLILGLPQNFETKSQVTLHTYKGSYKTHHIFDWIKTTVSKKVYYIQNSTDLKKNWLEYSKDQTSEVRMVMFTSNNHMPLFYSALSVKFPGRVKFGLAETSLIHANFNNLVFGSEMENWTYVVITKEKVFCYGRRPGESITFKSLDIFLRSLYPSVNDIFVTSLILCNCLTFFELSFVQGSLVKKFMKYVWCTVKFNMALLLIWMIFLTVFQLRVLTDLVNFGLKIIRLTGGSDLFAQLKADFSFYSNYPLLVQLLFFLYLFLIGYVKNKTNTPEVEEDPEWNFAQFRTLEHLFYPIQPRSLLNRNAMIEWNHQEIPSLWAAAHMSTDYIHLLPVWSYVKTQNVDSDLDEESEGGKQKLQMENKSLKEKHQQNNLHDSASEANSTNESEAENECAKNRKQLDKGSVDAENSNVENRGNAYKNEVPDGYLQGTQCVICLDNFVVGIALCGLPCGHCFHRKCILVWLMRDNHYCPICRWPSNKPKVEVHLHSE